MHKRSISCKHTQSASLLFKMDVKNGIKAGEND